jgi:hypothetical protein
MTDGNILKNCFAFGAYVVSSRSKSAEKEKDGIDKNQ